MTEYWDRRYRDRPAPAQPSAFVEDDLAPLLGPPGSALDVAGGAGRHSIWLARRGWDVTLVDASERALEVARERAKKAGVSLTLVRADLTVDGLPEGPWDLVLLVHYLQRDLFPILTSKLADEGLFAFSVATVRNLERRERPPLPFLLEEGEAPSLVKGLEIVFYEEGWSVEDRHDARLVAHKVPSAK